MDKFKYFMQWAFEKAKESDLRMRAFHAFWQSFSAVFIAGLVDLLVKFTSVNLSVLKTAALSLILASIAAGLSGLKTFVIIYLKSRAMKNSTNVVV